MKGFEPLALCTQNICSTKLSHIPKRIRRDSNPRCFEHNSFQDYLLKPLRHLSNFVQKRDRTVDTRIFSPLLYQLSYLNIFIYIYIEMSFSSRGQDDAFSWHKHGFKSHKRQDQGGVVQLVEHMLCTY